MLITDPAAAAPARTASAPEAEHGDWRPTACLHAEHRRADWPEGPEPEPDTDLPLSRLDTWHAAQFLDRAYTADLRDKAHTGAAGAAALELSNAQEGWFAEMARFITRQCSVRNDLPHVVCDTYLRDLAVLADHAHERARNLDWVQDICAVLALSAPCPADTVRR